jgi:hypothetical protein
MAFVEALTPRIGSAGTKVPAAPLQRRERRVCDRAPRLLEGF